MTQPLFSSAGSPFTGSWEDYVIVGVALAIVGLTVWLWAEARGRGFRTYSARLAWLQAGLYFGACWLISWATGVFKTLTSRPLVTAQQLVDTGWLAFTALCLGVIIVAYFIVWPRGTLTHGRALHWPSVLVFGLLWGASEAQLFLSFWAIVERFVAPQWLVAVVVFVIISVFNGLWHSRYWDIHVAPEHNIAEWNARKVLFAHIPNLTVTLAYLAVMGSAGMFVLFQTLGLVASTYFMRFPPFQTDRAPDTLTPDTLTP